MTNKKWVLILMSLILVIALAACGNNEEEAQEPEAEHPAALPPLPERTGNQCRLQRKI